MKDPYVYSGSNRLINAFNINDERQLEFVEKEITTVRLKELAGGLLSEGAYDSNHYKQFHRHIFGDIYPWAGEFRTVNIVKYETALNGYPLAFMEHESIEAHLEEIFATMHATAWGRLSLEQKTYHLSRSLSEIWRAHAFREGNTRTTITFFIAFCQHKGIPLEASLFAKHISYVRKALVASVFEDPILEKERNYQYIETIMKDALTRGDA